MEARYIPSEYILSISKIRLESELNPSLPRYPNELPRKSSNAKLEWKFVSTLRALTTLIKSSADSPQKLDGGSDHVPVMLDIEGPL